ncbi:MAG: hypothetical protein ACXVAW_17585 [Vulcanimicrobiaceae bacterium]
MRRALLLFAFGTFVAATVALPHSSRAATPAPTPVPLAHPDFSSMAFLEGTWTCHQQVRGKDRPDTSVTTVDLDGQYMFTKDVAPPFDQYRTKAVTSYNYMTYNAKTHQWVTLGVDNFGGYFVASSPGWSGNQMVTHVVMTQDGSTGMDTLTKISNTQTRDVGVGKDPTGKTVHSTITCSKSP